MKKIVTAMLITAGITSSLAAAEKGVYVGIDIGNTSANLKANIPAIGYSESEKDDGGSQTFKMGYYFDQNSRVAVFYQNVNADSADIGIYGVGFDYLIGDQPLKPFVGVFAGKGSIDIDDTTVDISGGIFGAQIGVNYAINENFSVEAGYRYMKANMEDTIRVSNVDLTLEVDEITNWFIGANYKF